MRLLPSPFAQGKGLRFRSIAPFPARCLAVVLCVPLVALVAGCGSSSTSTTNSNSNSNAGTTSSAAAPAPPVPFHLGVFDEASPTNGALQLGQLKGLQITQVTESSGGAALPLIESGQLAGQADIAPLPLVLALAHGVKLKAVWLPAYLQDLFVVRPSIHSLKDLEGKKVAAPAGAIDSFEMEHYLATHGVDTSKVEFVNLDPTSIVAAYKTGGIDGTEWGPPVSTDLLAAGARLVAKIAIPTYTVFSQSFIDDHASTVQKFVCGMAAAQDAFKSNPRPSWTAQSKTLQLPVSQVASLLPTALVAPGNAANDPKWSMVGSQSVNQIVVIGQGMAKANLVPTAPSAAQVAGLLDNTFAEGVTSGKCS